MSKFEVEIELQGFKMKVKGKREDIPMIAQNVGNQIAGIIEPAAKIVEGEVGTKSVPNTAESDGTPKPKSATKRKRKPKPASSSTPSSDSVVVNWRHDPSKWGSPQQEWNTASKSIWLLRVIGDEVEKKQLDAKSVADTFNHHFRQSGEIRSFNVSRDLGKLKTGKQAQVGEDTTKSPSEWYLTDTGQSVADGLVKDALGKDKGAAT